MKVIRKAGSTSNILQVFIADSSSTTGAGLTGLVFNTAGLTAYYHKDGDTTATAITLVTMTVGTFTSSGFKEIDATNMPGWYQLCPPDAAFSSGKSTAIHLKGATNMAPLPIEIDLDAQVDVTHFNGTAGTFASGRPEVNMTHIAGSAISTSTAQLGVNVVNFGGSAGTFASGIPAVNTTKINGTNQTARDIGASVLLSSGTGTGQISLSSGAVLLQATQTGVTIPTVTTVTTTTNLTNAPTSGDFTATMKTSIGTAVAASAVASVTGNVGGNVVGSVGSVTGLTASNLDATISSRLASASYTAPDNSSITAIKAKTDNLPASPAATSDIPSAASISDAVWRELIADHDSVSGSTAEALSNATAPTAADVADAVWREAITDHDSVAGSTAEALNAAGGSGDPWNTALPGAYSAGKAGYILGTYVDAAVSSRLATAGYTAPANSDITAIKTVTDALPDAGALTSLAQASALATVDGNVDSILTDTNELQTDWADGGRLDLILDARASQTSVDDLPTNAELATALGTADDAVLAAISGVDGKIDTVDTVVDAIKVKTDSLTFTVAGKVDGNITYVNGTAVTGDGGSGTEWGPA